MLAGCAASVDPEQPLARSLPPRESVVARPVKVPQWKPGDDAKIKLVEMEASALENARRLENAGATYDDIRKRYGAR